MTDQPETKNGKADQSKSSPLEFDMSLLAGSRNNAMCCHQSEKSESFFHLTDFQLGTAAGAEAYSESVDSKVAEAARSLAKTAGEALHATGSDFEVAQRQLQTDWENIQKRGAGFVRLVAEQAVKNNSSIGSMNVDVIADQKTVVGIEFKPSSWDLNETSSRVEARVNPQKSPDVYEDLNSDLRLDDAANHQFYLDDKHDAHGPFYSPVRPPGIGELNPGCEIDGYISKSGGKVDMRKIVEKTNNADGSVTYSYEGQVGGGQYKEMLAGGHFWAPQAGDVKSRFSARETISPNGYDVEEMKIEYETPKSMILNLANDFNDRGTNVERAKTIFAQKRADGNYQVRIDCADGSKLFCLIIPNGEVDFSQRFPSPNDERYKDLEWVRKGKSDWWWDDPKQPPPRKPELPFT